MSNDESIKKGGISVQTEHIFPVIKKWLYSEKEIFLREIVSNACDAVTKLKRLISLAEVHDIDEDFRIDVKYSKKENTISVTDNGIGMTAEELEKYLCNIALSGALEFIEKYENENSDSVKNGIIGHFGLGFYSAFMVSDSVEVISRSYNGAPAVRWVCSEDGSYETFGSDKETRGTEVIMHLSEEESKEFDDAKVRSILGKYCSFIPVEIYYSNDEKSDEKPINDISPLWLKNPSDCTKEEYDEFYHKLFSDYREPLFYIHINADYPLNFKGILYFPKINNEYENLEGQIKLYYNQVFVSDNIKDIIPEYLLMLKGVLDCPELPLNVSRSYLQNNTYVSRVSAHIVKKISDKLVSLFGNEREYYEKIWDDIKIFVEYGSIRDRKFFDRVKGAVLFKTADGKYTDIDSYTEKHKELCPDTVYYVSDAQSQRGYVDLFAAQGIDVIVLDRVLDTQFISLYEQEKNLKFLRVDAGIADSLKGEGEATGSGKLADAFKAVSGDDKLTVKYEALKDEKTPLIINVSEESRRMGDMMKMYAPGSEGFPEEQTLILNSNCPVIKKLGEKFEAGEESTLEVSQLYSLALLSQRGLDAERMKRFISESIEIMEKNL